MDRVGIIGGSALYDLEGLKVSEKKKVDTPFGDPSDELVIGELEGAEVVFIPRHGKGHRFMPTEINNRANIFALKFLGVESVLSVSAVGSLKEEIRPLDILLVDQFIDRTNQARPTTFFGDGIVAHIPFAEPVCHSLKALVRESNAGGDIKIHDGGVYINMEGPAFSTKAESHMFRSWGGDVIGMTNMPEARLCREAGICFTTIAMVTDYDCWRLDEKSEHVTVEMIIDNLVKNIGAAKTMIKNTVKNMGGRKECDCGNALSNAVITSKDSIPAERLEKLAPIIKGFI